MPEFNTEIVKTVQKQSLSSVICSQLEDMILSGDIKPGERINESQLSSLLGVSRAPIREACRQLERHGMVEVRVNKGTFVRELNITEVEELYEIRAALDALAGEKAAMATDTGELDTLSNHLKDMKTASQSDDHDALFKANVEFHMTVMRMAGNINLMSLYEGVCKKASLFRRTSLSLPGRLLESTRQHEAIFKAIADGDASKAAELMKHHIMDAKTVLLAACAESEDEETN